MRKNLKRKGLGERKPLWSEKNRRGSDSIYTRKNSIEIHGVLIHFLGIIGMEREGIEKDLGLRDWRAEFKGIRGGQEESGKGGGVVGRKNLRTRLRHWFHYRVGILFPI